MAPYAYSSVAAHFQAKPSLTQQKFFSGVNILTQSLKILGGHWLLIFSLNTNLFPLQSLHKTN